jgi:uncharacterized surface protein with fasciclin (FAS1) repeats
MASISESIASDHYMTTFLRGLRAAGLEELLSGEGPFTVFVPTDLSFGKLDRGVFQGWEGAQDRAELRAILNHHIVPGRINFDALTNGTRVNTLDGGELMVEATGKRVTVNHAQILGRDKEASNGVIHSIDSVILN